MDKILNDEKYLSLNLLVLINSLFLLLLLCDLNLPNIQINGNLCKYLFGIYCNKLSSLVDSDLISNLSHLVFLNIIMYLLHIPYFLIMQLGIPEYNFSKLFSFQILQSIRRLVNLYR